MTKIGIIGGGLVGSLQALFLARRGYDVHLYERRADSRQREVKVGKSINLALSHRGLKALRQLGLEDVALKMATPMYGRLMHDMEGEQTFQPYGKEGQAIYSLSRWGLNRVLLNEAEANDNITLNFQEKCVDVDLLSNELTFSHAATAETKREGFDRIIAADGAFSIVRQHLMKTDRFNYSQHYLEHGYKELTIPPTAEGKHRIDPNALHIWPRGNFMLIALPNKDGSFTCTLFMPFSGSESAFDKLKSEADVGNFFREQFADAKENMPDLKKEFFTNPTSSLVTVHCDPWNFKDRILLIGDAAHAIVPFYGQGMNAGFEDCSELDRMLEACHDNWSGLLDRFCRERIPNTNAIAELAISNYREMRDHTADPKFLFRKKIDRELAKKFPDIWNPMYSMVTFSDIPYERAMQKGREQEQVMDGIMNIPDIENQWDTEEVEMQIRTLIHQYL